MENAERVKEGEGEGACTCDDIAVAVLPIRGDLSVSSKFGCLASSDIFT